MRSTSNDHEERTITELIDPGPRGQRRGVPIGLIRTGAKHNRADLCAKLLRLQLEHDKAEAFEAKASALWLRKLKASASAPGGVAPTKNGLACSNAEKI